MVLNQLKAPVGIAVQKMTHICGNIGLTTISFATSTNAFAMFRKRLIHSWLMLLIYLILVPIHIIYYEDEGDIAYNVMSVFRRVLNPLVMVISVSWGMFRSEDNAKIANEVCYCAEKIQNLTGVLTEVQITKYVFGGLLVWSAMCLMKIRYIMNASLLEELTEVVTLIYLLANIFHLAIYAFTTEQLLINLNASLKNFLEETNINIDGKDADHKKKSLQRLQEYGNVYHDIFVASRNVMGCFGGLTAILVLMFSIMLVISGFFTLASIKEFYSGQTKKSEALEDAILCFQWPWFSVMALFYIVYPCAQASYQSDEIIETVNSNLVISKRKDFKKELHAFSTILLHEKVMFAPCDLFILNNGLLLTVVGGAISYLVVANEVSDKMTTNENGTTEASNRSMAT